MGGETVGKLAGLAAEITIQYGNMRALKEVSYQEISYLLALISYFPTEEVLRSIVLFLSPLKITASTNFQSPDPAGFFEV